MNQVKKNFLYNVFYQMLAIFVPLITIPYVSRVLGVDGVGIYSYSYSIVYYFMLIAMLGINNYGSREIAKKRNNLEELSRTFSNIYFIQFIFSILSILIYVIYVLGYVKEYKSIFLLQSLYIFSSLIDINWFYYGVENFKLTVTRNSLIKLLSLILIFLFVRQPDDLWIYTLVLSVSTLISNCILLVFLKKYIKFSKIEKKEVIKNIKPCLILFIPVIAMKIYKVMDKTMIGVLSSITEVGYYSNADSILNVPMGIIVALGTVMLPRLSNMISNGDTENANRMFFKSLEFSLFFSIPIMFGMMAVGKNFAIIFLGSQFAKSGTIIQILSMTILFMTIANVIRTQYLIPNSHDKQYIFAIVSGAVVNLISNIIFISKYGCIGACVGTILAEFVVMLLHVIFANKYIPIVKYIFLEIKLFISGLLMFIVVNVINYININIFIKLFIQVIVGVFIYCGLNYKYIKSFINTKRKMK